MRGVTGLSEPGQFLSIFLLRLIYFQVVNVKVVPVVIDIDMSYATFVPVKLARVVTQ